MKLTLLQYNNYFNNIAKKAGNRLSDYTSISGIVYKSFTNINFFKADGVTTEQTINYAPVQGVINDDIDYDYCIVSNDTAGVNDIASRWFILESHWNRKGQRHLVLRRDLRVDAYDIYKDAAMFVERAICDTTTSAIYNTEPIRFSQQLATSTNTLQETVRFEDDTTPQTHPNGWIVGYVSNNSKSIPIPDNPDVEIVANLESSSIWRYLQADQEDSLICKPSEYSSRIRIAKNNQILTGPYYDVTYHANSAPGVTNSTENEPNQYFYIANASRTAIANAISSRRLNSAYMFENFHKLYTMVSETELSGYNGHYIYCTDTLQKYKVLAGPGISHTYNVTDTENEGDRLKTLAVDQFGDIQLACEVAGITDTGFTEGLWEKKNIELSVTYANAIFSVQSTDEFDIEYFPAQISGHSDSAWNSFFFYNDKGTNSANMLYMMSYLKSAGVLQDAQIVPYLPINNYSRAADYPVHHLDYETYNGTKYYFFTNQKRHINNFTIPNPIWITNEATTKSATNIKKNSLYTTVRLCASDHSAYYDFNPAQANITSQNIGFTIEQTMLPFSTQLYIHTNLNGLYGGTTQYNNQGLIYTLNNSIPLSSNAWIQYISQNSAYAQSFNRQIENLTTTQNYQHQADVISAVTNTISATVSAGTSAALASGGNPYAAVAGGLVGGIASGVAGAYDVQINDKLRAEQKDYTIDMYNYSLQNIQARPNTLVSTGINTATNHILPIVEIYKATINERDYWTDYQVYYAWNIGRIGKFSDYSPSTNTISHYFKGSLMLTDIINKSTLEVTSATTEDTHFLNALNEEIKKGGYYYI